MLAGIVESQAFGHLNAFTPLFLQQLHVPQSEIPTWTGILAALAFVIGLPLLPFWGICQDWTLRVVPAPRACPGRAAVRP